MVKESSELRILTLSEELGIEAIFGKRIRNTFQRHIHSTYLFGLVEKGVRHITCDDRTYSVAEQELFMLQPAQVHACTCSEDHCYSILSVSPELIETLRAQKLEKNRNLHPCFTQIHYKDAKLSQQLQDIFTLITKQGMSDHALTLIQTYISTLLQHEPHTAQEVVPSPEPIVKNTCAFLKKNHAEKLPLSAVAEQACLSPFHFQRLFTKRMGISPSDYLQAHRVAEARQLLQKDIPLSDVSVSLGFYDQSHFSRIFRKMMGVSPGAYRKTNSK
ncbi:AraC family transcriptional regulator [Halodesulfovibrio marinisediminis]|uniref:AraC-type DNA-binding protein n=1 Tax=Halodesulfovibrio marinisediminis DSM 17456 TaxID=1121457 RepID=A0A1N6I7E7_9BACT|nr:AraC family transcriptional regulator [Halodesulfovibrio marinisediminis]SIO27942.1 AraC-type DNA-binding protein [Halodesulfovibrio marinisediminis DSM 17456]